MENFIKLMENREDNFSPVLKNLIQATKLLPDQALIVAWANETQPIYQINWESNLISVLAVQLFSSHQIQCHFRIKYGIHSNIFSGWDTGETLLNLCENQPPRLWSNKTVKEFSIVVENTKFIQFMQTLYAYEMQFVLKEAQIKEAALIDRTK